ncbi:helix-turn-helix domain-containing protein [Haloplanus sp. GCM10025708]|uniref:helix-turn-helix domain-containing protein n=1 Tax=Haloplanus sp. GCM10025708 TaxID=3252679 RepID=UPI003618C58A
MDGARLTDLANELDLPRSTTHRYLATLLECGCVVKEGNEYQLGLKFLDIGGYTRIRKDVYKLVEPKVAKQPNERKNGRSSSSRNTAISSTFTARPGRRASVQGHGSDGGCP